MKRVCIIYALQRTKANLRAPRRGERIANLPRM